MPAQLRRIDTHAHVHASEFDQDREAVIVRALEAGTGVMNVGTGLQSSKDAIALAEDYPEGLWAVIGRHPVDDGPSEPAFDMEAYRALAKHPKVVGIGECGLDYFRLDPATSASAKATQKRSFSAQIALANECGKALMLHIREAYGDALEILKAEARVKGNSHFFAGTIEEAKGFLDLGYTLSFTGVITFAREYADLVEYVPLDMIQAETDCPFVAPMPYRGKRNEPVYVSEVIAKIARVKKLPVEEVEEALLANARRMWGISI